jgi:NitT/TauT family transport system permease protein
MAVEGALLERELAGLDALAAALPTKKSAVRRIWSATWPPVAAAVLIIAFWQVVVWTHWRSEVVLPSPFTVLDALKGNLGTIWKATATTLVRGGKGFVVSIIIGTAIGLFAASFKVVRTAIGSMITGLQTMPSVAWTVPAIVIFKAGGGDRGPVESAIMFVIVMGAAPSVANGLLDGIDNIPPILLRAGRALGASKVAQLRHVIMPAALPTFVSGLKQAWSFAWRALMGAELIVHVTGVTSLGEQMRANMDFADYAAMYSDLIAVFIIGIAVDKLLFAPAERAIRRRYGLVDAAAN